MMAQLDMPAMLFTTLALWLFLRERIVPAALACIGIVLVKETGIVAPLIFAAWLAYERRWRDAAWFLAPVAALGGWIAILAHATGHWTGSPGFVDYNLFYPLHPARLSLSTRCAAFITCSSPTCIGLAPLPFFSPGAPAVFSEAGIGGRGTVRRRACRHRYGAGRRDAGALFAPGAADPLRRHDRGPFVVPAQAAADLFRGARWQGSGRRAFSSIRLILFLTKTTWHSPILSACKAEAADYLRHWYPGARVATIWPMTIEVRPSRTRLRRPAHWRRFAARPEPPQTLARVDWGQSAGARRFFAQMGSATQPAALWAAARCLGAGYFGYEPNLTEQELCEPGAVSCRCALAENGQWMDIYVNPRLTGTSPAPQLRAAR